MEGPELEQSRHLHEVKEKEIYDSGITLKKSDPAHFVAVFNKQTPKAKELSRYGYATLEASRLLTKQFMLTRQQVVYGLERVELRSTDLFQECPFRSASIPGFEDEERRLKRKQKQFAGLVTLRQFFYSYTICFLHFSNVSLEYYAKIKVSKIVINCGRIVYEYV